MNNSPRPLLINGIIPKWENPEFTPGIHCTSCRYGLCSGASDFKYTCEKCLPKIRAWKKRSDSAKRAALKRRANKISHLKNLVGLK